MKHIKAFEHFTLPTSSSAGASIRERKDSEIINSYINSDESKELTDEDVERVISQLERDCPKFLAELKSKKIKPIFRGTYQSPGKKVLDIERIQTNKFRVPKDMAMDISNTFNDVFRANFGVPIRSEGVFATKSPYVTKTYGTTKMFFPIGNYRYFWNPDIEDLYTYVDENLYAFDIYDDDIDNFEDDDYDNRVYSFIEEIASNYKENDLEDASAQELTFICDNYYLVNTVFYNKIYEYLKSN